VNDLAVSEQLPTRVYFKNGRVAHLLHPMDSPNWPHSAACGRFPSWNMLWRGTGSYNEADYAARLPTCRDCANLVG
jgi:hypothetical protein